MAVSRSGMFQGHARFHEGKFYGVIRQAGTENFAYVKTASPSNVTLEGE
jgi:hypothetical protein